MHPILFKIGPVTIYSYGVIVAAAFLTAFLLLYRYVRLENFFPDKMADTVFFALIAGVISARLLHVAVNMDYYKNNLLEVFFIWKGGLAIYGGILFGIIAGRICTLKYKIPFWKAADFVAPFIALGQAIGRIGCFLKGCCYGRPATGGAIGVVFPSETIARYPTQIYASLSLFMIFIILKLLRGKRLADGSIFLLYFMLYGAQRFFIDFLRGDNPTYLCGLTVSQIISVPVFMIAFFALAVKNKPRRGNSG